MLSLMVGSYPTRKMLRQIGWITTPNGARHQREISRICWVHVGRIIEWQSTSCQITTHTQIVHNIQNAKTSRKMIKQGENSWVNGFKITNLDHLHKFVKESLLLENIWCHLKAVMHWCHFNTLLWVSFQIKICRN